MDVALDVVFFIDVFLVATFLEVADVFFATLFVVDVFLVTGFVFVDDFLVTDFVFVLFTVDFGVSFFDLSFILLTLACFIISFVFFVFRVFIYSPM